MPMSETVNISQQEKSCVKGDQHHYKNAKIDPLLQKSRLLNIACFKSPVFDLKLFTSCSLKKSHGKLYEIIFPLKLFITST